MNVKIKKVKILIKCAQRDFCMLAYHQCPVDEICDFGAWCDDCGGGWCEVGGGGDASLSVCVMSCGSAGGF